MEDDVQQWPHSWDTRVNKLRQYRGWNMPRTTTRDLDCRTMPAGVDIILCFVPWCKQDRWRLCPTTTIIYSNLSHHSLLLLFRPSIYPWCDGSFLLFAVRFILFIFNWISFYISVDLLLWHLAYVCILLPQLIALYSGRCCSFSGKLFLSCIWLTASGWVKRTLLSANTRPTQPFWTDKWVVNGN